MPDDLAAGPAGAAARREPRRREVFAAWAASAVLTVAFARIGDVVPLVRVNLLPLVAAVFLYLPGFFLRRRGADIEAYGWRLGDWRRGLKWGFGLSALTLVLFVPGFHFWATTALDLEAAPDAGAWSRLPDRLYGAPAAETVGHVHVWHDGDRAHVRWTPQQAPWRLSIESDGRLITAGTRREIPAGTAWNLRGDETRPITATFHLRGGHTLAVRAEEDGAPIRVDRWALGADAHAPRARTLLDGGGISLPISLWWLPLAVLVQLLLIALPEEFFYRGYLQQRLDEARGAGGSASPRRTFFGLYFTRSIIIISVLFALGHFVIEPHPARLAVFFPSLLFGFLRHRTGGLVAPVVFHAACNLMATLVAAHYL